MTHKNWERFGELNELNCDTEKEKLLILAERTRKRMILLIYKKWQSKVIPLLKKVFFFMGTVVGNVYTRHFSAGIY